MNEVCKTLHEKAMAAAQNLHRAEVELINSLMEIDNKKVFMHLGFASLFEYCIKSLKLSEANAYNFITVARKAKIVPELKLAIEAGSLSVSKARKLTPVITRENSPKWIELAQTLPKAKLEKEIAKIAPQTMVQEKMKYIAESRIELKLGISEEVMNKLKRTQDIVSQKTKKAATLEETLNEALSYYLEKQDPMEKAKRNVKENIKTNTESEMKIETNSEVTNIHAVNSFTNALAPVPGQLVTKNHNLKGSLPEVEASLSKAKKVAAQATSKQTRYIPAEIKHQVVLRDEARCTYVNTNGQRCENKRWLELHHKQELAKGGKNSINNLITLCSIHHKLQHW